MEVFIETLTGSAFELKVSPMETVMSVKAKIQRLEGIPVSQQHLIWQSKELEDECSLQDYKITAGATLKLVISMRGGPINTRRVHVEDSTWKEITEYVDANREEIWDKMPGGRQVTLLVFRDGDQINFFRVVDRGDGTVAPISESLSTASVGSLCEEKEVENVEQKRMRENDVTMQKMRSIRKQMEALTLKKKPKRKLACSRLQSYASPFNYKSRISHPLPGPSRPFRLPPVPGNKISLMSQPSSRAASPPQAVNPVSRPRGASVISVVSRRSPQVRERGARRQSNEEAAAHAADVQGSPVVGVAATAMPTHECHALSDIRALPRLHGDGVLRVETSCSSSSDSDELEPRWGHQNSWPTTSVVEAPDSLSHSESHSNGRLQANGALAMGMLSADMPSRRGFRNPAQHQQRPRATIDNFEQLQQTLAKFDPRISVQASPRARISGSPSTRTVLDNMNFLGKPMRREKITLINNLDSSRPKTSPEIPEEKRFNASKLREDESESKGTLQTNEIGHRTNGGLRAEHSSVNDGLLTKEASFVPKPSKLLDKRDKLEISVKPSRQPAGDTKYKPVDGFASPPTNSESLLVKQVELAPGSEIQLNPIRALKKAHAPRCQVCKRKTGLATSYTCRCGKNFCATHRYAEMHECTYNYKNEGRKILELSNPLVTAPKLPKI